jgi:hypothetical protein
VTERQHIIAGFSPSEVELYVALGGSRSEVALAQARRRDHNEAVLRMRVELTGERPKRKEVVAA